MKKDLSLAALVRNNEIIIASGLIILVVIILTLYFLLPNYFKANQIFSQTGQLRSKLSVLNKKDELLGKIDANFYKDTFPKVRQILPNEKDFVSLFYTFDTLQFKAGVTISRTEFQFGVISTSSGTLAKASGTAAFTIPMTIEVSGEKGQIKKFLDSLTDLSGRMITVENVQWNFKTENEVSVLINGLAYYYPLSGTIGSIDTSLPELNSQQTDIQKAIAENVVLVKDDVEEANIKTGKKDLFR